MATASSPKRTDSFLPTFLIPARKPQHKLNPTTQIDYTRLAQLTGAKSAASARECLRQTKKKLQASISETNGKSASTSNVTLTSGGAADAPNTGAGGKKRARSVKTEAADGDDGMLDEDAVAGAKRIKKGGVREEVQDEEWMLL